MSDSGRYFRSSSGLWKPDGPISAPAYKSSPSAHRLPIAPKERAASFAELARIDMEKGNFGSAETNFRLAVTYAPEDVRLHLELKEAIAAHDAARRGPPQSSPSK